MENKNLYSPKTVFWIGILLSFVIPVIIHFAKIITAPHEYLSFFIGLGMTSLTLVASLILNNQQKAYALLESRFTALQSEEIAIIKDSIDDLNRDLIHLNKAKVMTIDRDNLYKKMKTKIGRARRINLTYLAKSPPDSTSYTPYQSKKEYLQHLETQISGNAKSIKRIILYTDNNKDWIKSLADSALGKDKFSLSVLQDNNMIPRVPFQIIDDNYLIILGKVPSESVIKRDIIIESKDVIQTYEVYYEKLWQSEHCFQIVENGQKNESNYNELFRTASP